nr:hypothetical protein [Pseudodesulfovibrio sp.]
MLQNGIPALLGEFHPVEEGDNDAYCAFGDWNNLIVLSSAILMEGVRLCERTLRSGLTGYIIEKPTRIVDT